VVQADPLLLEKVAGMLEDGGYEVLGAENAVEAFRFLETRGDEVLALFADLHLASETDLASPMDEPTLEQAISARWPHIRHFLRGSDIGDRSFDHAKPHTH